MLLRAGNIRLVILGCFLCITPVCARAQSTPPRQLTLIRPDDQEFETVLEEKYPGLQNLDCYAIVRPFLLVLKNSSSHSAVAYAVDWQIVTSGGMLHHQPSFFVHRNGAPANQNKILGPGEVRLLAPTFNVSASEYAAGPQAVSALPTSVPPYTFANITSIASSIEAVVYEDGAYSGAHPDKLLARYVSINQAQRDIGNILFQAITDSSTSADIDDLLNSELRSLTAADQGEDPQSLYRMARWREVQSLRSVLRSGGVPLLKARVSAMTQFSPVKVWPLPQ